MSEQQASPDKMPPPPPGQTSKAVVVFGGASAGNARSWLLNGDSQANSGTYVDAALPTLLALRWTVTSVTASGTETWLVTLNPPA